MNVKELRIGNLIEISDYSDVIFEIEEIEYSNYKIDYRVLAKGYNGDWVNKDWVNNVESVIPIPLTNDWMIKFGFELFPWGFVKNKLRISFNSKTEFRYISDNISIQIKSVHQLQNLYFALTGDELTL